MRDERDGSDRRSWADKDREKSRAMPEKEGGELGLTMKKDKQR